MPLRLYEIVDSVNLLYGRGNGVQSAELKIRDDKDQPTGPSVRLAARNLLEDPIQSVFWAVTNFDIWFDTSDVMLCGKDNYFDVRGVARHFCSF